MLLIENAVTATYVASIDLDIYSPMLISNVTGPSVQATNVASKKQANNLYFRRRR